MTRQGRLAWQGMTWETATKHAWSPGLEVKEQCPWDVVVVIGLIEEDILTIASLERGGGGEFSCHTDQYCSGEDGLSPAWRTPRGRRPGDRIGDDKVLWIFSNRKQCPLCIITEQYLSDPMLAAERSPELAPDLVAALSNLKADNFSRHGEQRTETIGMSVSK